MALWKILLAGEVRLAIGPASEGPTRVLAGDLTITDLLSGTHGTIEDLLATGATSEITQDYQVRAPLDGQEVWAAGVTYMRSKLARNEEAPGQDYYDRVYEAERPEIFLKAAAGRTRGPRESIGVRADSTWNVPEPELAAIIDATGAIVAYSIGNDVSSRSIEGENPLYLPQAKVYDNSCAIGPCLVPASEVADVSGLIISLKVERGTEVCVDAQVGVDAMARSVTDLVSWLFRANHFPGGVVLLTGTGVVPDSAFDLSEGDEVSISITGLGTLRNPVIRVGAAA